ncbi:MAG: CBS domain-containing protein, partial [Verrucomicrobiales bacterium]|nr:CBS domain-containing protein [Verrucomicrobiales bacterium]
MKHTGSEKYNPAEIAVIDSLISHSESALSDATVENLHDVFNQSVEDFIAIVDRDDVFRGIVSRRDHQALLSGRYGFSLFRDESILDHLVDKPVVFRVGMSLQDAAAEIFSNDDVPDLQTDAVIVDRHNKYIGIVPAKDLIYYQWKLSREQAKQISQQENAILRKNRTIFEKQDELRLKEGQFSIIFENDIVGVALLDPSG